MGDAHRYCRTAFDRAVRRDVDMVIVDNCNLLPPDYDDYMRIANQKNYVVAVIEFVCTHFEAAYGAVERSHVQSYDVPRKYGAFFRCQGTTRFEFALNSTYETMKTKKGSVGMKTFIKLRQQKIARMKRTSGRSKTSKSVGNISDILFVIHYFYTNITSSRTPCRAQRIRTTLPPLTRRTCGTQRVSLRASL